MWGTRSSVVHRGRSEGLERVEMSHPDQSLKIRLSQGWVQGQLCHSRNVHDVKTCLCLATGCLQLHRGVGHLGVPGAPSRRPLPRDPGGARNPGECGLQVRRSKRARAPGPRVGRCVRCCKDIRARPAGKWGRGQAGAHAVMWTVIGLCMGYGSREVWRQRLAPKPTSPHFGPRPSARPAGARVPVL